MSIKWKMKINQSAHKKLSKALAIAAMESAMRETMRELRDALAEEPTPKKTGNLRRSHTYEVNMEGKGVKAQIKNNARTKNGDPYWFYVNFGTSRMTGRHFLEQTLDNVKPSEKIVEKFKKQMRQNQ